MSILSVPIKDLYVTYMQSWPPFLKLSMHIGNAVYLKGRVIYYVVVVVVVVFFFFFFFNNKWIRDYLNLNSVYGRDSFCIDLFDFSIFTFYLN